MIVENVVSSAEETDFESLTAAQKQLKEVLETLYNVFVQVDAGTDCAPAPFLISVCNIWFLLFVFRVRRHHGGDLFDVPPLSLFTPLGRCHHFPQGQPPLRIGNSKVDTNSDGRLTKEEFIKMFRWDSQAAPKMDLAFTGLGAARNPQLL